MYNIGEMPINVGDFRPINMDKYRSDRNKFLPEDEQISWEQVKAEYEVIQCPSRGTTMSAGYDFVAPFDITVGSFGDGNKIAVPTGIRWVPNLELQRDRNFVLSIYPRSSTGCKKGLVLANGTGIIDADYYMSENDGDIIAILTLNNLTGTPARKRDTDTVLWKAGEYFIQGIFTECFHVSNDCIRSKNRTGGFGSTTYPSKEPDTSKLDLSGSKYLRRL